MTKLESTLRSPGDNEIYIRFSIYKPTHTRKIIRRNNNYYTSKKIKYLGLKEHGVNLSEVDMEIVEKVEEHFSTFYIYDLISIFTYMCIESVLQQMVYVQGDSESKK